MLQCVKLTLQLHKRKGNLLYTGEFSNTVPVSTGPDQEPVEEELQELYNVIIRVCEKTCSYPLYYVISISHDQRVGVYLNL